MYFPDSIDEGVGIVLEVLQNVQFIHETSIGSVPSFIIYKEWHHQNVYK